jgi:hypothetical protein
MSAGFASALSAKSIGDNATPKTIASIANVCVFFLFIEIVV